MANPLLNDKAMGLGNLDQSSNTWAPPTGPVSASPDTVSRWDGGIMTVSGTATATLTLLMLILVSATITWTSIDAPVAGDVVKLPTAWIFGGLIIGIISVIVASVKQHLARIAAPIYALAEGVVLGAISRAYSEMYQGIVVQAVGATLGVFVVMLLMYRSGVVRVNDKYRRVVMGAMMGLMGFYLVSMILGLFGSMPSFIHDASPMGILFSIFVAGLAASNLAIDFDMIERGVANKLPAHMEWFCALGVTVTLVWLYLEILRLLSKLRER
jgi:uncharacterized YccA/Bax inhibitor family protein